MDRAIIVIGAGCETGEILGKIGVGGKVTTAPKRIRGARGVGTDTRRVRVAR